MGRKRKEFCISGEEILTKMQTKLLSLLEKKAEQSIEYQSLLKLKQLPQPQKVAAVRFRINGEWAKPSFLAEIWHSKGVLSVIYDLQTQKLSLDNRQLWKRNIKENEVFLLKGRNVKYTQGNIVEA